MTCNISIPNISESNLEDKCSGKCSLVTRYLPSSCVVINQGDHVSVQGDGSEAIFNQVRFISKEMRIYRPSLHLFGGARADAELVIIHESDEGGNIFVVCVPVVQRGGGSETLSAIVADLAQFAPAKGERVEVSKPGFIYDLAQFVPAQSFFTYTGDAPFRPCGRRAHVVVFGIPYAVGMSSGDFSDFKSVIKEYSDHSNSNSNAPMLFINDKGVSSSGSSGDNVLIDCQPVDVTEMEEKNNDFNDKSQKSTWSIDDFLAFISGTGFLMFAIVVSLLALLFALQFIVSKSQLVFGHKYNNHSIG